MIPQTEKHWNKEIDTTQADGKYFEGVLCDNHPTPLGHQYIALKDTLIYKFKDGIVSKYVVRDMPKMAFIVPKRRERICKYFPLLKLGTKILIKVMQESRSEKWTVAEVEVLE